MIIYQTEHGSEDDDEQERTRTRTNSNIDLENNQCDDALPGYLTGQELI